MKKLHTSFNSNTQIFFNLPCLSLVLPFNRRRLLPLLLILVTSGKGTVCWLFGQ